MATHPIKSLFGSLLGLTRPTTTFRTERLFSKGGFIGPAIYLSTTEGSETAVNIQGFTDVATSSTATAALGTRGITVLTSGASTAYTLAAPPAAGVRKVLTATSASTLLRQVTSVSQIVTGMSAHSDSGTITASTAMTVMSFNGLGQVIELLALSTSAWVNTSLRGFSTATTPLSS